MRLIKTLSLLLVLICLADCIKIVDRVVPKSKKLKILESSDYAEAYSEYMKEYSEVEDRPASGWIGNNADFVRQQIKHKRNFVHQLRHIKEHNKKFARGWSSYEMTVNSFTMMDEKERLSFTGLTVDNSTEIEEENSEAAKTIGAVKLPAWWDWVEKGYVTRVKRQGSCQSCWAFAAVGVLEWVYKKATGTLRSLSEQELVDCTYDYGSSCDGGWYTDAWRIVMQSGHMASMSQYSYKGRQLGCNIENYDNQFAGAVKIKGYKKSYLTEQSVLSDLVNQMPLAVAITTEHDFFLIDDGLYDGCDVPQKVTHGVVLTGYGAKYFRVKNSWGPDWGENGYTRMLRGKNICNILSYANYLVYEDLNTTDGNEPIPVNNGPEPEYAINDICEDTGEKYCAPLLKDEGCYNPLQRYRMKHCLKTCGFCSDCLDYDKDCEKYKELGYCDNTSSMYISHTKKFCQKTCGFCEKKSVDIWGCPAGVVWCKDASNPKGGYCTHIHMCKSAQH